MRRMYWNPFREMEALRREIDRAFESYGLDQLGSRLGLGNGGTAGGFPLVNVSEDKDAVYVQLLAPGLNAETLEVSVLGDQLTIAGERPSLFGKTNGNGGGEPQKAIHRNERGAGRFVRAIELPTAIDQSKVEATYDNGLLLVTLHKSEQVKPRQVTVKVG